MRKGMRTIIVGATAALVLAAAGALVLATVRPPETGQAISSPAALSGGNPAPAIVAADTRSGPLQIIGSYATPDNGKGMFAIDMPGARMCVRTSGIAYNYYEFDCTTLQFVNPQNFDHPDIENDVLGWVCWTGSATNLGLDFGDWEHAGIGSRSTGQLLYEFPLDDEMPYMYAGMADGVEVMIIISEFHGKSHFLNLSQPGFLGTVTWPVGYETPDDWIMDFEGDYMNWHALNSYCYNSQSQTLFVPISHLGLVYWCQIGLSGGFNYTTGTISCGTKPQFIAQSTDGSAIYVFDDEANQVTAVNPLTRQTTSVTQFEAGSELSKMVYHQGYLYFPLTVLPLGQHVQRLVKLNPANGSVVQVTVNGWPIMDLDAFGSGIYALQHDIEDDCHLLEFRASDLQLMDDVLVGDKNTIRLLVDAPSSRLVVYDDTNESLVMVQL